MKLLLPIAIHYNLYNKKTHIHKDEIYRLNLLKKYIFMYILLIKLIIIIYYYFSTSHLKNNNNKI